MNNRIRFIPTLLIIILFVSTYCTRPQPECLISDEFKSYVLFGEGTFWVYQSNMGVMDTVEVIKVSVTIIEGEHSRYSKEELFFIVYESTLSGEFGAMATCANAEYAGRNNCSEIPTALEQTRDSITIEVFYCCCDPDTLGQAYTIYQGLYTDTVNEIIHDNLMKFYYDSISTRSSKYHFYEQNKGLVKYEKYNGEVWELINYKIEEYQD